MSAGFATSVLRAAVTTVSLIGLDFRPFLYFIAMLFIFIKSKFILNGLAVDQFLIFIGMPTVGNGKNQQATQNPKCRCSKALEGHREV
jgi:hypothetical protein